MPAARPVASGRELLPESGLEMDCARKFELEDIPADSTVDGTDLATDLELAPTAVKARENAQQDIQDATRKVDKIVHAAARTSLRWPMLRDTMLSWKLSAFAET